MKFDIKHNDDIEPLALVGNKSWEKWLSKLTKMTSTPKERRNRSHKSDIETALVTQKRRLLWIVFGLRSGLFLAELVTGLWTHSLSLLAVSGHMLVDVLTIGVALGAAWLAERSFKDETPFDPQQVEAWAALINSLFLMGIAAAIAWEAVKRFYSPEPVAGLPMLMMAALGFVVKGVNASLLYEDSHYDLNLRGVFLHAIADAASSVSLILAALAVFYLGWLWADAAGSLLVACLMTLSALLLIRDSLRILSE